MIKVVKKVETQGNRTLIYAVFIAVVLGGVVVGIDSKLFSSSGVMVYESLVEKLTSMGAEVEPIGEVTAPFFSVAGKEISVNGNDVQIFEHPDVAATDAKSKLISEDGLFVGTQTTEGMDLSAVEWGGTPHFYKKGKLIVVYVGDDKGTKDALTTVLGSQFAGGK